MKDCLQNRKTGRYRRRISAQGPVYTVHVYHTKKGGAVGPGGARTAPENEGGRGGVHGPACSFRRISAPLEHTDPSKQTRKGSGRGWLDGQVSQHRHGMGGGRDDAHDHEGLQAQRGGTDSVKMEIGNITKIKMPLCSVPGSRAPVTLLRHVSGAWRAAAPPRRPSKTARFDRRETTVTVLLYSLQEPVPVQVESTDSQSTVACACNVPAGQHPGGGL